MPADLLFSIRCYRRVLTRALLLALVLSVLAGCSTRFLFNQLDWFITWRLNSYFSLEKEQKARLRDTVERNLEWVRVEQMPQYAQLLRQLDADVADGSLTPASLDGQYQEMIVIFDQFLRHVIPDAAGFLADLHADQVEVLIDNLEDENDELDDKYSGDTVAQRQSRRAKAIIKNTKRFTGRLSNEQEALVNYHVSLMHDNSEEWLRGRRAWQQDFRALLLESPPADEYAERLLAMSLDPNSVDSPAYRRKVEENRRILLELFSSLILSLDDKQLARLHDQVTGLADDLEALAAQVLPAGQAGTN